MGTAKQALECVADHDYIVHRRKAFSSGEPSGRFSGRLFRGEPVFFQTYTTLRIPLSSSNRFEELVKEYKDSTFNMLFRLSGDYHLSQDLFQETFIRVYRGLKNFQFRSKLSTWIYSIAVNVFRDHVRKRRWGLLRKEEPADGFRQGNDEYNPEIQFIRKQEREEIQKKICGLRESIRVPLVLYYIEGMNLQQISEITKRSISDIKVSLHRARKKLKETLEKEGPENE
jgi:RNA polymerase sigma factor (sigma-70 family)